jgi:hypothetical protein
LGAPRYAAQAERPARRRKTFVRTVYTEIRSHTYDDYFYVNDTYRHIQPARETLFRGTENSTVKQEGTDFFATKYEAETSAVSAGWDAYVFGFGFT